MPWKLSETSSSGDAGTRRGYTRNDTEFMFNLAEKVLFEACLAPILSDVDRRAQFLKLVEQLMDWTIQKIVPPFANSRRGHRENTPFEWIFRFSSWCGKICAQLTAEECRTAVLRRVFAQDNDTALLIMESFLRSFMINAILAPANIGDDHQTVWQEIADWLFDNSEWSHGDNADYLGREFQGSALCLLFCVAPEFSPLICGVDPGWTQLPKFLRVIERAIREFGMHPQLYVAVIVFLRRGGFDLLPDPALRWLHNIVIAKKRDQAFWNLNGDRTVEIIKTIVETRDSVLRAEHRRMITLIADILVDNGVRGAGFFQQEMLRGE